MSNNLRRVIAVLMILCCIFGCSACREEKTGDTYTATEIFSNLSPSVVWLKTAGGGGTGFFIEENVIATNNHVIAGAEWITAVTHEGTEYPVIEVIGESENPDLALLKVDFKGVPVKFNTHGITEGETVYSIGAPMGIYPCISDGIVVKSKYHDNDVDYILSNFHAIGGNSGGPLFNSYGELMGVVVGGMGDGSNHLDMVIYFEHLSDVSRNTPRKIMTYGEYMIEINRPEEEKYNQAALDTAEIGDVVTFGRYEQDGDMNNGAEDIYWLVIDKRGNELMLLSLYCLDAVPYSLEESEITWETSYLREFLNNEFHDTAFTEEEQRKILTTAVVNNDNPVHGTDGGNDTDDRVYTLSFEEVMKLYDIPDPVEAFYDQLYACATEYTISKGVWLEIEDSSRCWWWLRSPGGNDMQAGEVGSAGYLSFNGTLVTSSNRGARPTIWVTV